MSIKRKLMAIILASTTTALLLVAASILIYEFFSFRDATVQDLQARAEIIGNDNTAPLIFGDYSVAEKRLSTLSVKPDIIAACLYKNEPGKSLYDIFATYHSPGHDHFDFPKQPLAEGHFFMNGNLVLFHYFKSDGAPVAIFLESDLAGLRARLLNYGALIAGFTLTSLILTFMLASRLLRVISRPIYHLAQTSRVVSTQKNYAVRAIKESNDELGRLIEDFNEMLSQIQERDVALHRANEELEQRVRERTRDLEQQFGRISLLNQITHSVATRQDFESIVSIVLQKMEEHLPVDYTSSYIYDARADAFNVLVRGPKSQTIASVFHIADSIPVEQTHFRQCLTGEMVYVADARKLEQVMVKKASAAGLNSGVGVPLMIEGKPFGLLVLMRREAEAFSRAELDFIRGLGAHVALAIHQVQLYQDLQKAYNDLRQSQQAVMQQERLKALGQMASGVAHDINNALSPIVGFSDLIGRTEQNITPATRKHLGYIKTAGEDIAHIVKRLREFYRPRDQNESLQSLKLGVVAKEVVDMMQPRWRDIPQVNGINIEMRTEFDPDTPRFAGIESEVREALTNLIMNAVEALPQGGIITVRTCAIRRTVKDELVTYTALEVIDNGIGMEEQIQKRCLEPFFSTKGKRGTGLGLAMVYGVVERHEGKIEIESKPGKGTTMRLLFSIRKIDLPDATEIVENGQPPSPLRILCIDDEPALRMLIGEILQHDGHKIESADGGQAGINAFQAALTRKEPFDVVVTDLGMPFVDGNAVARAVKSQSSVTPVIMLTGWGAFLKGDGDIPKEVDGVLSKPPRIQEMRSMLRRVTHK